MSVPSGSKLGASKMLESKTIRLESLIEIEVKCLRLKPNSLRLGRYASHSQRRQSKSTSGPDLSCCIML